MLMRQICLLRVSHFINQRVSSVHLNNYTTSSPNLNSNLVSSFPGSQIKIIFAHIMFLWNIRIPPLDFFQCHFWIFNPISSHISIKKFNFNFSFQDKYFATYLLNYMLTLKCILINQLILFISFSLSCFNCIYNIKKYTSKNYYLNKHLAKLLCIEKKIK